MSTSTRRVAPVNPATGGPDQPPVRPLVTVQRQVRSNDTRTALIDAAEELFASQGVEGPSLREINRAAGQRNTTALQYHFGDRKGLLIAVLQRHALDVANRRRALLDLWQQGAERSLRGLVNALVLPLFSKLSDSDGGPNFLSIAAELMNRGVPAVPGEPAGVLVFDDLGTMETWSRLVEPFVPEEGHDEPFHRRRLAIRLVFTELGRRARTGQYGDAQPYANHLVDIVGALLSCPFSAETLGSLQRGPEL